MFGREKDYGNAAIGSLLQANRNLMEATVGDALGTSQRYGKSDTLGLDAIPEISIASRIKDYDPLSILITEEQSEWPGFYTSVPADPLSFRTFFISDPTDRSSQFAEFLREVKDKKKRVLDVMRAPRSKARWEAKFSAPASITGPYSAITCIRRGMPVLTALVNYLTQEMFLACSAGVFKIAIDYEKKPAETLTVESICSGGERVGFGSSIEHYQGLKRFVTFLGDERKKGYKENFFDSQLLDKEEFERSIFYGQPGGPSRILYLSTVLPGDKAVGFILANGEKIGEWIHWLPFIRFARSSKDWGEPILNIYEVWHPRPNTKEGILMSTSPNYSVFGRAGSSHMVIDVSIFQRFANPSKIRSTLLVCLNSNDWAQQVVQRHGYRKILFP